MATQYPVEHVSYGSTFPLGPVDGAQHYRTDGNNAGWFTWDNTRGKWLSNEPYYFDWTFLAGQTVGASGIWTIPVDATVVALWCSKQDTSGAVTYRVGGASGPTLQVLSAKQSRSDFLNPNFDIAGGADMAIEITAGTVPSGGFCRATLRRRLT